MASSSPHQRTVLVLSEESCSAREQMLSFILETTTWNLARSAAASPLLPMMTAPRIAVLYAPAWTMIIIWPRVAKSIHTMMEYPLVRPWSKEKDFRRLRGLVNQGILEASNDI